MKTTIIRIACLAMVLLMMIGLLPVAAVSAASGDMNRYNVVFVTDVSGSMNDTDPDALRYEAIELFVGLIANGGNKVGSVMFSNGVRSEHELVEVDGRTQKQSLMDAVRAQEIAGWTDIGGGLKRAVSMLDKNGDPNLPSIMILLTDGNTEMGTAEETARSIADKEDALEAARDKSYQIYAINLNKDNSANSDEMRQIAAATGGQFQEVTDAADLQEVFDLYYQLIYSTKSIKLADESIPASGTISRDFNVADLGVEEVNVVVFGDAASCALKRPDGTTVSDADMANMLYKARTFSLIKIEDPLGGTWNLSVNATPGSSIKIFKIYNPNMKVETTVQNAQDAYTKGEAIRFATKVKENDTVITDTARYAGYTATLTVTDYDGNTVHTEVTDTAEADGFITEFTPADYGSYYAHVSVETEELFAESDTFTINVGNTPPTVKTAVIKKHVYRWPFLLKTDATVDLSEAATDAEDDTLTYRVVSSTWLEEDYTLDGSELTVDDFTVSKGSFTVEAIDSMGAYATVDVKITSTNVGFWAMVAIIAGILLAIAIAAILTHLALQKPFMGSFTVENLNTRESGTMQKNRGRLKLSAFQIGATGLDRNSYFQATGKSFVYYVSKKPVYADNAFKKSKKIKIDTGMDVRISASADYDTGILVRFDSMLNNPF